MTRARVLWLAMLASGVSTACAVRYERAAPRLAPPAAFVEAPAPPAGETRVALERWWTAFQDPILDDLAERAIRNNLDLRIAETRVREARAARGLADAARRPNVGVRGHYGRIVRSDEVPPFNTLGDAPVVFGPRQQNLFEVGFDAAWELDVFGGLRLDIEAAHAQVRAVEEAGRDVLVTLIADVARLYVEVRGLQRQLAIVDATLATQDEIRTLARARVDAGLDAALGAARADALVAATEARRPELERRVRRALYRLGVLLGRDVSDVAPVLEAAGAIPRPIPLPEVLPSELLVRRPDVRRAEQDLAAAVARLGVAHADLRPRFLIGAVGGRRSDEAHTLVNGASGFLSVLPSIRWPVFSGGRLRAAIAVHEARQDRAVLEYERTLLGAVEDVENALAAVAREERRLEALRDSREAERHALMLATERYAGGLESFVSVLDAQRSLYAADTRVAESETDMVTQVIALCKALGGGWTPDATSGTGPLSERRQD